MFKNKNVTLTTVGDREFKLEEDLVYHGKDGDFVIPAGFVTDFASVPAMVTWLIPSYGKYTLAAIVHDWLCVKLAEVYGLEKARSEGKITPAILAWKPANARDTDGIFRRIMRELEVPFLRRWLMWTGVRWGAMMNPARREGIVSDLPLMLLWSVLALPIVVIPTLFVFVGLAIDGLFEKLVGRFLK